MTDGINEHSGDQDTVDRNPRLSIRASGQSRSFGDVGFNVRFARKRTWLGDLWARRYRVETEGFLCTVVTVPPNFALLEMSHPEVASLVAAMLQARDAVERRSWSHPQEPTSDEWQRGTGAGCITSSRSRARSGS